MNVIRVQYVCVCERETVRMRVKCLFCDAELKQGDIFMVERVQIEPCDIIEQRNGKVTQYAFMLVYYASRLVYYASMLVYEKENVRISIIHYARMNIWGYIYIVPYLEVTRSTLVQ